MVYPPPCPAGLYSLPPKPPNTHTHITNCCHCHQGLCPTLSLETSLPARLQHCGPAAVGQRQLNGEALLDPTSLPASRVLSDSSSLQCLSSQELFPLNPIVTVEIPDNSLTITNEHSSYFLEHDCRGSCPHQSSLDL